MSGERVTLIGDGMAAIVQGVDEVAQLTGERPVVVGGLAVLCRLSTPYRATIDLDVVDRRGGSTPHLAILRAADGARAVEPAAVVLPTRYGDVRVDVLEVRQVELDEPSDDPGDRLHATSHAWAFDTATELTIVVVRSGSDEVEVTARVAEPGPLVAMKLQSVMNRSTDKQGTDLLDIVRLVLDRETRRVALAQLDDADPSMAADMALHVDLWFVRRKVEALTWIRAAGGRDVTADDLDLVGELLLDACRRESDSN